MLLQVATLLAPPPATGPAEDAAYAQRFAEWAAAPAFDLEALPAARPATPEQASVLVRVLEHGAPREVRIAALLASGCAADSRLAAACWRAGGMIREEGAALGALLAPQHPAPAALPALAWLAMQTDRPLSVRAVAVGRLLEADCSGAWPVARSILRTGTRLDEDAPWSDWARVGRYELPKRALLVSVDAWFAARGGGAAAYEPNAAWSVQAEQLQALEVRATARAAAARPLPADVTLETSLDEMMARGLAGDDRAARALALLLPHSHDFLARQAAQATAPAVAELAARILATAPR